MSACLLPLLSAIECRLLCFLEFLPAMVELLLHVDVTHSPHWPTVLPIIIIINTSCLPGYIINL